MDPMTVELPNRHGPKEKTALETSFDPHADITSHLSDSLQPTTHFACTFTLGTAS